MTTLRELTENQIALRNRLEEMNFDEQTIEDSLDGNSTELQAKIENYGYVICELESFVDAIKAEEERIIKRRKINESRLGWIKEWLKKNMEACGISKVECPAFTVALQNNPQSVVVDSVLDIPGAYMRTPPIVIPESVPDKKLIAEALKTGLSVPGAHLTQTQRLVIK